MDRDSYIPLDYDVRPEFHSASCDYEETEEFTHNCVYCMRLWNEFLERNNIHVVVDKSPKTNEDEGKP